MVWVRMKEKNWDNGPADMDTETLPNTTHSSSSPKELKEELNGEYI